MLRCPPSEGLRGRLRACLEQFVETTGDGRPRAAFQLLSASPPDMSRRAIGRSSISQIGLCGNDRVCTWQGIDLPAETPGIGRYIRGI